MGYTGGHITAPVNTDDISSCLGHNSHDVGTLCLSTKINRFNKHKPYRGTSPQMASRVTFSGNTSDTAVSNSGNGTGCFCGNRGSTSDFPIYWGLQYPMNTVLQSGSGFSSNNLIGLCYEVVETSSNKHPNYEYMRPVAGTDYFRMEDFIGYAGGDWRFLTAGVAGVGAVPTYSSDYGKVFSYLQCNRFAQPTLRIYAMIPSNAVDWQFRDLIQEPDRYYLVAEFYKVEAWTAAKYKTATPFLIKSSEGNLFSAGMSISFDVTLSEIKEKGNITDNNYSFFVCVGFNKKIVSGNDWVSGSAFIAPWDDNEDTYLCATKVMVLDGAPFTVSFPKYFVKTDTSASGKAAPTAESDYKDYTANQITAYSSDMFFKAKFRNSHASESFTIFHDTAPSQGNTITFRARAVGSFPNDNGANTQLIDNANNGKYVRLEVRTSPDFSTSGPTGTAGNITVGANSEQYFYCRAVGLIPYGNTTTIIIEASNDKGETWTVCGSPYFNILRT